MAVDTEHETEEKSTESMNTSQTALVDLNSSISRSGQVRTTKQSSDTSILESIARCVLTK